MNNFRSILSFLTMIALVAQMGISPLFAQENQAKKYLNDNRVLMNIGGDEVTVAEFMNVYLKNNVNSQVVDKKTIDEYLDLYINFKLKVRDAENRGMDTLTKFTEELLGYREQLAQPYFVDESITEELVAEAYERMQEDVRASHILMKLDKNALPEDTARVYKKMMKIRKRIMNGEDFNDVAVEVSEDPSAQDRSAQGNHPALKGNRGDLGFFTVFNMVYPFESAAYNLEVDEVSMPVRSDFGYHLIKTTGKYPALGTIQVAHIYFRITPGFSEDDIKEVENKANAAYEELLAGANWEETVKKYSDDRASKVNKGLLPKFGVNRMVPEFIEAIRVLDTGEFSKPVRTNYGIHIIKLVERDEIGSFDQEEKKIRQKLKRDSRGQLSKGAIIARIKKEYGIIENFKALQPFYKLVDSSIFMAKWDPAKADGMEEVLFSLADKDFTQADFAQYLADEQSTRRPEEIPAYVNAQYYKFVDESCRDYEDKQLEKKYPEFRLLVKEYRDGILLFDLTDEIVWSKAIKDTTGLRDFHKKHEDDYMWKDRKEISVFEIDSLPNGKAMDKLVRKLNKSLKKLASDDQLKAMLNADTNIVYKYEKGKYEQGVNEFADMMDAAGALPHSRLDSKPGGIRIVRLLGVLAPQPKALYQARGIITADYQNYLEKEWVKELREKYSVDVDSKVMQTLK